MKTLFAFIAICSLLFNSALAEHEVDHRYTVQGYVLDENKNAIGKQDVRVYDGTKMLAQTKTDSAGYYSIHLHLHNEDIGRKLELRSGSRQGEFRVAFDPDDITTQRVHEASFVGDEYVEGSLNLFRIPPWIYPLIGIAVLFFIAAKLEKRRRRKLREKHAAHGGQHASGHKKKKKRKKA